MTTLFVKTIKLSRENIYMDIQWNSPFLDIHHLIKISRGDKNRMLKYLDQFQALIPQRIKDLEEALQLEHRSQIQELLHQMLPQIHFFGIPKVLPSIEKIELEYQSIPMPEMNSMVLAIIRNLNQAIAEADKFTQKFFSDQTKG